MTRTNLISTGQDAFGAFEVRRNPASEPELCIAGEHTPALLLVYLTLIKFPEDIQLDRTILRSEDGAIGIDCGCYAKFHRQVAHIQDQIKFRKEYPTAGRRPARDA